MPHDADYYERIHIRGRKAFLNGEPAHNNPYSMPSPTIKDRDPHHYDHLLCRHLNWRNGWNYAQFVTNQGDTVPLRISP